MNVIAKHDLPKTAPMTAKPGSRGLLYGRPGRQIFAAAFVTALLVFAACVYVWIDLGGGAWHVKARVQDAEFHPPDRLRLILDSCYEFPRRSAFSTAGAKVKVGVDAFYTFPRGKHCQDYIDVRLQGPLGERTVYDVNAYQSVSVRTVE